MVGRSHGRSVGQLVGRSIGRSVEHPPHAFRRASQHSGVGDRGDTSSIATSRLVDAPSRARRATAREDDDDGRRRTDADERTARRLSTTPLDDDAKARSTVARVRFSLMIHFALLFSKQGKIRLSKYYVVTSQKDRKRIERDVVNAILPRHVKSCNVVEYKDLKLVYRKYASLYFCLAVDRGANELATLEQIQHYVEILDKYFGNVCELDLVFNFHKAHYVLDEVFIAGHLQETSKKLIARLVGEHDALVESAKFGGLAGEDS